MIWKTLITSGDLPEPTTNNQQSKNHMARGVNKVIVVGGLGADPEVRYMPSGGAVTNISVATSDEWTDKKTNEKQKRTEWHQITLFNRLGEIAGEYLRKGSQVYIEGSLRTEKYQDKETGQDRYSTKIIASNMQLLGGRSDNDKPASQAQPPQSQQGAQVASAGRVDFDDDIDSIPF